MAKKRYPVELTLDQWIWLTDRARRAGIFETKVGGDIADVIQATVNAAVADEEASR